MFVARLHLLQSLQPDRVVLDESRMIGWQERGREIKKEGGRELNGREMLP